MRSSSRFISSLRENRTELSFCSDMGCAAPSTDVAPTLVTITRKWRSYQNIFSETRRRSEYLGHTRRQPRMPPDDVGRRPDGGGKPRCRTEMWLFSGSNGRRAGYGRRRMAKDIKAHITGTVWKIEVKV